jgi:hypothetical protein
VNIAVQLEPIDGTPSAVDYTWDPDTEILSAQLRDRATGAGMSGSVGLEGPDGSWLILDVAGGRISAVEVAVWPEVRRVSSLVPPSAVDDAQVVVAAERTADTCASLEFDTSLSADADAAQRTIHFRLGKARGAKTVRVARDILLDLDRRSRIAGVWLLNVPPCPEST